VTFPARAWVFLRFYFPWTFAMGNPFEHSPWGILLRINHFVFFFFKRLEKPIQVVASVFLVVRIPYLGLWYPNMVDVHLNH
jgi:hypothetical protein